MRELLLPPEAAAWPLAAPEAFRPDAVAINQIATSFVQRARDLGFQADEARREYHMTGAPDLPWSPQLHLIPQARTLLDEAGPVASLRMDPHQPGMEILRWRWASLSLPPLLWIAAATAPDLPPRCEISLLQGAITPTHFLAHQHLHAGAVYPFELLWSRLASHLDLDAMSGDGDAPRLSEPCAPLWRWVVRAMAARRWLGHRLLDLPLYPIRDHQLPRSILDRALVELEQGTLLGPSLVDLYSPDTELARYARGGAREREPRSRDEVWRADPLWRGHPCPDACLLHQGLHRWDALGDDQRLFTQYLRVKVALFRHLRSDPASSGLPSFTKTYGRIRSWSSDLEGSSLEISVLEPELPLGSVELRTSPDPIPDRILDLVAPRMDRPDTAMPQGAPGTVEWGWVLHLIRARGKPEGERGYHHRRYREHLAAEAALRSVLTQWPALLTVLRGLDLAGDETSGPLWLAVPSLQRLRACSDRLTTRYPGLRPLALTLHAGEDYHHLLSGLRAVHEPFTWGLMRAGDRLGHAIALTNAADRWVARGGAVEVRRWDRLLDLLWLDEHGCALGAPATPEELRRRAHEISELVRAIWGIELDALQRTPDVCALRKLPTLLGDPHTLERLGLSSPSRPEPMDFADELLVRLIYDTHILTSAHQQISVSRVLEQRLLGPLQRGLRRLVARARVTVEANPSSNLLVAGLEGILDQPALRLRPTDLSRDDLVELTLSADDPLSFSTRLADEYAYAWAAMVWGVHDGDHVGPRYATAWLEEAARSSWRSRFTIPSSMAVSSLAPPGLGDRSWASPPSQHLNPQTLRLPIPGIDDQR